MKKFILLLLFCIAITPNLFADDKSSIYLGVDLGYLDPIFSSTIYNQVGFKLDVAPGLEFSVPINYVLPLKDNFDSSSLGCALNLDYHPFENGLLFSFSLFDLAYVFGSDAPPCRLNYLNQIGIGYSFPINKFLFEPTILFINPNGVYDVTINQLKDSLGGYPTIRCQFIVSYKIFEI
jgi:hypothetical protein